MAAVANICIKTIVNIAYTLTHTEALCGGGVGGRERRGVGGPGVGDVKA